jgi:hypothetical protein
MHAGRGSMQVSVRGRKCNGVHLRGLVMWHMPRPPFDYTKQLIYFGCSFLTGMPHKNLNVVSPVFS